MPEDADDGAWRSLLQPYYEEYGIAPDGTDGPVRRPFDETMCASSRRSGRRSSASISASGWSPAPACAPCRRSHLATATSVEEARRLVASGVDAVIAQGWEAGGHAGRFLGAPPEQHMGLFALLPQIVDATGLPVIAAGGIADGRGIAAAFMLGAAAVQIGTAYLHSPESLIVAAHRAALHSEAAERTAFTNLFSGGLARGLRPASPTSLARSAPRRHRSRWRPLP
jgi:nitronate monooxygenase